MHKFDEKDWMRNIYGKYGWKMLILSFQTSYSSKFWPKINGSFVPTCAYAYFSQCLRHLFLSKFQPKITENMVENAYFQTSFLSKFRPKINQGSFLESTIFCFRHLFYRNFRPKINRGSFFLENLSGIFLSKFRPKINHESFFRKHFIPFQTSFLSKFRPKINRGSFLDSAHREWHFFIFATKGVSSVSYRANIRFVMSF